MKYQKQIAEFKAAIKEAYRTTDTRKPKKGSKEVEIMVWGRADNQAMVQLKYSEQFYRMFGKHNFVDVIIFTGDLKEACQVARELKAECGLKISYLAHEEIEYFM
jgi:hypothetical protein